jgi:hypothetical protein
MQTYPSKPSAVWVGFGREESYLSMAIPVRGWKYKVYIRNENGLPEVLHQFSIPIRNQLDLTISTNLPPLLQTSKSTILLP